MDPITMKLVADDLIRSALREDITYEDVSTVSVCPEPAPATVELIAKAAGVIAGLDVFERTFQLLDPATRVERLVKDGDEVAPGQVLAHVAGDARVLLSGERVALNYLQRMSGIATLTRFEKEAVRAGGGSNHRYNLSTAVMLKDNHIDAAGGITAAVRAARAHASFTATVEVECESLDQVREAVAAGADIVMLDNMDHAAMAAAVELVDGRAKTEASGNVDEGNVRALADLGVDFISSGALTHSAGILDLSLKHLRLTDSADR